MGGIILDALAIASLFFIDYPFQWVFGWSVYSLTPHFDKVLHFTAGLFVADIYCRLPFKKTVLRTIGFVGLVAILWECIEPFFGFWGIGGEPSALFTSPWLIDTIGDITATITGGVWYELASSRIDNADDHTPAE